MSTAVATPGVAEVPPGAEPVLETENLVKVYGRGASRFDALKGITLQIQRGESLAVVGKSGSGKSTLMHLLALLDQPSAGVVAMDGRPVSQLKAAEISQLRNERFGFVFQQFFLNPNQTVLENTVLPLKIAGVGRAQRTRRGMAVLERLELADKAKNKATDLSGGQKQRVCIARALVNEPTVLFADEPTGNLDTATSTEVLGLLRRSAREMGQTVIMVTHDPVAASAADRVVLLADGRLAGELVDPTVESVTAALTALSAPAEGGVR